MKQIVEHARDGESPETLLPDNMKPFGEINNTEAVVVEEADPLFSEAISLEVDKDTGVKTLTVLGKIQCRNSRSSGEDSFSVGFNTVAENDQELAEGRYNVSHRGSESWGDPGNTIHSIGIGTEESNRKNAVEVMQDGKVYVIGAGNYDGKTLEGASDLATILNGIPGQLTDDQLTALNWSIGHRQSILQEEAQAKFAITTSVSGNTYVADTTTSTTMTVTATLKFDGSIVQAQTTPTGWTQNENPKTYTKSLTAGSGSIAAQQFTYKVEDGDYKNITVSRNSDAKSISATYPIYYGFVNTSNPADLTTGGVLDITGRNLTRSTAKYTNASATLSNALSESGYYWILTHSSATATQSGTSILKPATTVTLKSPQNPDINMSGYKLYISSNSAAAGGSFDLVNININI